MATNTPVTGDTPITIKISVGDNLKKLKLPFKDLTADVLPAKLTHLLALPVGTEVTFERFSDSAGSYVVLNPSNTAVYKSLVRAAKAKLKLRLRANVKSATASVPASTSTSYKPSQIPIVASGKAAPIVLPSRPKISTGPAQPAALFKRTNVGAGIFDFKDRQDINKQPRGSRIHTVSGPSESQPPQPPVTMDAPQAVAPASLVSKPGEAPLPQSFTVPARDLMSQQVDNRDLVLGKELHSSLRSAVPYAALPTWSVFCNACDATMTNEHFHCNICDGGDYDLCQRCVDDGMHCSGKSHWLVKRFVKDGQVVSSTTERLPPKHRRAAPVPLVAAPTTLVPNAARTTPTPEVTKPMPGAFSMDSCKTVGQDQPLLTRVCNTCVDTLPESQFYTCLVCVDHDICKPCFHDNVHGHHPAHAFRPAVPREITSTTKAELAPGRNTRHFAMCDGCDKQIFGVRHKCFDCPDFDFCGHCRQAAHVTHPGHRFAPLYEPIPMNTDAGVVHHGIYCDGASCMASGSQTYIRGVRYKCVVCDDFDLCAGCEAQPVNAHNKTHPLLKISSPLRGVSVSTVQDLHGEVRTFGRQAAKSSTVPHEALAAIARAVSRSSASTVKTVAHIEPTQTSSSAIEITKIEDISKITQPAARPVPIAQMAKEGLDAQFVSDTIPDGINVRSDTRFTQVWTMRNTGSTAWPAGCSVRSVGGDNMLNVTDDHPIAAATMAEATESNVVGHEVKPGEEVAFKVVMKAPSRAGRAISYWRLKTADGTPFGHRLWCDIMVHIPPFESDEWTVEDVATKGPVDRFRREVPGAATTKLVEDKTTSVQRDIATMATSETASGQMIYPTLDKESPASSTYQSLTSLRDVKGKAATVEDEETGHVTSAVKDSDTCSETSTKAGHAHEEATNDNDIGDEVFEDISSEIEVLSASSTIGDDDGFLTDEEYDILDGSDQETVASSR